jgi:hypothetical protein
VSKIPNSFHSIHKTPHSNIWVLTQSRFSPLLVFFTNKPAIRPFSLFFIPGDVLKIPNSSPFLVFFTNKPTALLFSLALVGVLHQQACHTSVFTVFHPR